jgi:hypothetical protein
MFGQRGSGSKRRVGYSCPKNSPELAQRMAGVERDTEIRGWFDSAFRLVTEGIAAVGGQVSRGAHYTPVSYVLLCGLAFLRDRLTLGLH